MIITILIIIYGVLGVVVTVSRSVFCQNLRNTIKRNVDPSFNKCGHFRTKLTLAHATYGML